MIAAFLIALAVMIGRRSPIRPARHYLAAFLALVALNYVLDSGSYVVEALDGPHVAWRIFALFPVLLDPPLLLLFALAVTRGAPSVLRTTLVLAPAIVLGGLFLVDPPTSPAMSLWPYHRAFLVELAVYYGVAFALVTDAHVRATRPAVREHLGVLTLALGVIVLPRLPLLYIDSGLYRVVGSQPSVTAPGAILTLLAGLVVTSVIALGLARARTLPRNRDAARRTLKSLAGLLGLVAGAWVLVLTDLPLEATFPLIWSVRWFLFSGVLALGLTRVNLLDLPADAARRLRRGFALVLAALATAQVAAVLAGDPERSLAAALTSALALVALVAAGALVLARARTPTSRDVAWRREALYRSHVELGASPADLASVQRRLGLTDAEAADVRALVHEEGTVLPVPRAPALEEGARLADRFEVGPVMGVGTFGRVHHARDTRTGDRVVLKELKPEWRADAEALARWRREAEVALHVAHPHLVNLRGVERTREGFVLVFDHVDGETLRARLASAGPLPPAHVAQVARDVLGALAALHAAGLVHRDVKPENVMLTRTGRAVLLDLGAVTVPRALPTLPGGFEGHPGTPLYMAPEQARGARVTPAADVYAAATVLREALTGHATSARVPDAWARVLTRALADDPDARWPDAGAFLDALPRVV